MWYSTRFRTEKTIEKSKQQTGVFAWNARPHTDDTIQERWLVLAIDFSLSNAHPQPYRTSTYANPLFNFSYRIILTWDWNKLHCKLSCKFILLRIIYNYKKIKDILFFKIWISLLLLNIYLFNTYITYKTTCKEIQLKSI